MNKATHLKQQQEEIYASDHDRFAPDIAAEMRTLKLHLESAGI
jgi:hypothetical protein